MSNVYFVTHGDRTLDANPGMTENGFRQVEELRPFLPDEPSAVVCGTGRRHLDTAKALKLKPTRYTGAVGVADSKNRNDNTAVLADGTVIPYGEYSGPKDREPSFRAVVASLPDNAVVITSRPMIKLLGNPPLEGRKATVYRYDREEQKMAEIGSAASDNETDDV